LGVADLRDPGPDQLVGRPHAEAVVLDLA
jgi:hypothetical protein